MISRFHIAISRGAMFIARVLEKEYEPRQGFHQTPLDNCMNPCVEVRIKAISNGETKFISFDPEALHFGVDEIFALNPYGVRKMIYVSCYQH